MTGKKTDKPAETGGDTGETIETDDTEETDVDPRAHLEAVGDGCGCAEIWEHLSEQRDQG